MSELVALCFDADASPSVRFRSPVQADQNLAPNAPAALYGWGLAWYPSSERGASLVKDPTSSGESAVSNALGDWKRFRSTVFICHLRGHRRPRSQEDTQPFVRSYGGRQWIFAHDGDLATDWTTRFPLADDPSFEPLGRTDSEHAFCWLLAQLHGERARSLSDVPPERLHGWMRQLNAGGRINALLTDGELVAVYRDERGHGQLHWTRRLPPHPNTELSSDGVQITLDAPEDPNRTALVFSSIPMTADPWQPAFTGELMLARRGSIQWTSHPQLAPPLVGQRPDLPMQGQGQVQTKEQLAAAEPLLASRSGGPGQPQDLGSRTLRVSHTTHYSYDALVERSSHRLLVRPVEDRGQGLLDFGVSIQPAVTGVEYEDVFGNAAMAIEIGAPYSSLQIESQATVLVRPFPSIEQRADRGRHTIPLVWMPWQRQMLSAYLMPPELPESQLEELSAFAMSFVERNDYDLVGTLLDLNETIYNDFEYVSGLTTNETKAFEVFESRRGVCQDFANLMICLARLLHVPARYRMGYILTDATYENKIQSEASHAWLELYLPRIGWHGFDPTNGIQVGRDHIRVACGRNYRDATPTSGTIYRGGGTETLTVGVRVSDPDAGPGGQS